MLKISTETPQKPCRSSPKRPTKLTTNQNVSKAIPKAAKVHKKSPKGGPKAPKRVQKDSKK